MPHSTAEQRDVIVLYSSIKSSLQVIDKSGYYCQVDSNRVRSGFQMS